MEIVYLIGNGFDLNLGMKTRYADFYQYYLQQKTDNEFIRKFKQSIRGNLENWSDLEEALGMHTNKFNSEDEAIVVHDDLIEQLSRYLADEENRYSCNADNINAMHDFLAYPERDRLLPIEARKIQDYRMRGWNVAQFSTRIISFNYTKTLEKTLGDRYSNVKIGEHNQGMVQVYIKEIEHVHGYVDNRMILGLNDLTQVANQKFRGSVDVTDRYVKPDCNATYGIEHDHKCGTWIDKANLICVFGLSFGASDKLWWEHIGQWLKQGGILILFEYNDQEFNGNHGPQLKAKKESIRKQFLSKTTLTNEEKSTVKDNIFISYNSDMFNVRLEEKTSMSKITPGNNRGIFPHLQKLQDPLLSSQIDLIQKLTKRTIPTFSSNTHIKK